MTWQITPLDLGTALLSRGLLTARHGPAAHEGELVPSPSIGWLLKNTDSGELTLVDSGPHADPAWGERYHNMYRRTAQQSLTAQLAAQGVRPEQISRVILTHLHWDHAYGVFELPNAEVLVQKAELHYAIDPLPNERIVYETSLPQTPFFLTYFSRLRLIDGEQELCPGLRLLPLPGHTPGSQGVLVSAPQGRYLIAGDLINCCQNWEQRIPGGIHSDLFAYFNSFERIAALGDVTVLPSHDYQAWDMLGLSAPAPTLPE